MVDNIISPMAVYEHLEVFRTGQADPKSFLGTSPAAAQVRRRVNHARKQPLRPVLITGPSGSGKELVAELITRSSQDMVSVNCAAVPKELIESEFFGHCLGAFTGARKSHKGFFEQANGGDLFLDEIGDSPLELQAKLLRVLESGRYRKVGSDKEQVTQVRVIAATNTDLEAAIREKRFRLDLYYRLYGLSIDIPPLRDRIEDLAPLVARSLWSWEQTSTSSRIGVSEGALDKLTSHSWSGNVRELNAVIQNALYFAKTEGESVITPEMVEFPNVTLN